MQARRFGGSYTAAETLAWFSEHHAWWADDAAAPYRDSWDWLQALREKPEGLDALVVGPTGSRRDLLLAVKGNGHDVVFAGCFHGTLQEFEAKTDFSHGMPARDLYRPIIALLRAWRAEP